MTKAISHNFDVAGMQQLSVAREHGAYASLAKLKGMTPEEVAAEVTESGLRGRGGAGFSTGKKWSFVPRASEKPVYLVVNADESEPGTFKDRAILERDPHLLVEGIIIAAYAIGADTVYVYFRGEYHRPWQTLLKALDEARAAGLLNAPERRIDVITHRGAGAYICGEETALLNSIEGVRGTPRIKPPYPAVEGLFGCPTIVNNVETLAALPFIMREGARAYRALGTPESPGTKLISVSGHVNKPGVYEVEMGTPIASFLANECEGTIEERALKAVIPGGPSVAALTAQEAFGARIDHESLVAAGSQLGSGGMIVMDETASIPAALADITRFFAHESCGRCAPCREGSAWIHGIASRVAGGYGSRHDLETMTALSEDMDGRTICVFSAALATAVTSLVTKFRGEFDDIVND